MYNFVGYGIAMLGVGIGLGLIGNGAMHGMSRQPEAIGKLQTVMLIAMAFVEVIFLVTLFLGKSLLYVNEAVLPK
jgi:F-type H+-transporting ATPase subunit c